MLPPEVAARWAAPLGVLCEERGERLGIAVTQRLCGGAKLIDQSRSMTQVDESSVSVRGAAAGRGGVGKGRSGEPNAPCACPWRLRPERNATPAASGCLVAV